MNNTLSEQLAEFFYPDGEWAVLLTPLRLTVFAVLFYAAVIAAWQHVTGTAPRQAQAELAGLKANSIFMTPTDGFFVDSQSDLYHRNVNPRTIKSPVLREFVIQKMQACQETAPPNIQTYIDPAGGRFECVIMKKP